MNDGVTPTTLIIARDTQQERRIPADVEETEFLRRDIQDNNFIELQERVVELGNNTNFTGITTSSSSGGLTAHNVDINGRDSTVHFYNNDPDTILIIENQPRIGEGNTRLGYSVTRDNEDETVTIKRFSIDSANSTIPSNYVGGLPDTLTFHGVDAGFKVTANGSNIDISLDNVNLETVIQQEAQVEGSKSFPGTE